MESPLLLNKPTMLQKARQIEGQSGENNDRLLVSKLTKTESTTDSGAIPRGDKFKEVRTYVLPDGTERTKTKEIRFFKGRYEDWEQMFENMPFDEKVVT